MHFRWLAIALTVLSFGASSTFADLPRPPGQAGPAATEPRPAPKLTPQPEPAGTRAAVSAAKQVDPKDFTPACLCPIYPYMQFGDDDYYTYCEITDVHESCEVIDCAYIMSNAMDWPFACGEPMCGGCYSIQYPIRCQMQPNKKFPGLRRALPRDAEFAGIVTGRYKDHGVTFPAQVKNLSGEYQVPVFAGPTSTQKWCVQFKRPKEETPIYAVIFEVKLNFGKNVETIPIRHDKPYKADHTIYIGFEIEPPEDPKKCEPIDDVKSADRAVKLGGHNDYCLTAEEPGSYSLGLDKIGKPKIRGLVVTTLPTVRASGRK